MEPSVPNAKQPISSCKKLKPTTNFSLTDDQTESPKAYSNGSTKQSYVEEISNLSTEFTSSIGQTLPSISSSRSDSKPSSREVTAYVDDTTSNHDGTIESSLSSMSPTEVSKILHEDTHGLVASPISVNDARIITPGITDNHLTGPTPSYTNCRYGTSQSLETQVCASSAMGLSHNLDAVSSSDPYSKKRSIQIVETPAEADHSKNSSSFKLEDSNEQYGLVNYHCDICSKDITHLCRVRCAECEDFDLCVGCFSRGAESDAGCKSQHKNYHKYIPVGRNTFPLYKSDWSADEEVMLLEGVSKFGLGNWNEVADLVNSVATKMKRSQVCERHYFETYLNSRTSPLPDPHKLLTSLEGGPIALDTDVDSVEDEKSSCSVTKTSGRSAFTKPSHQVVGYWPLRGDFDVEYDNDAELILADMEFKDDETAQERYLKLQIIEIYNSKLDERLYRKRTVIERGLLDVKALQQKEKKRTKEERELHNLLRPLARFHSEEEHERFIQVLIEEKHICSRLQKLQEWKSLELKTFEEVRAYEEEKKRRDDLKNRGIFYPYLLEGGQKASRRSRLGGKTEDTDMKGKVNTTNSSQTGSILQYPGAALLSEQERTFCEGIGLPPVFYLLAKKILLHEALSNEHFNKEDFTKILRLDANKSGQLYDFFLNLDFNLTSRNNMAMLSNPEHQTSNGAQSSMGYRSCSSLQPRRLEPPLPPTGSGYNIGNSTLGEAIKTEGAEFVNV